MYTVLYLRASIVGGEKREGWIPYDVATLNKALDACTSWALDYRIRDNSTGTTYKVDFVEVDADYVTPQLGEEI
jgi:hypothetical protein